MLSSVLLLPLLIAPNDFELVRIVGTGDAAPDGNGVFGRPVLNPVINEDGDVALAARTDSSAAGIFDDDVLILADDSGWEILGREGDPSPDGDGIYGSPFPATPALATFAQPAFGELGLAISRTLFVEGAFEFFTTGYVAARRGAPTEVLIRDGYTFEDGSLLALELLSAFGCVRSSGDAAIMIDMVTDGAGPVRGFWDLHSGAVTPIVSLGDGSGDFEVTNFHEAWIATNEVGQSAFVAGLGAGPFGSPEGAVVRFTDGVPAVIARENRPAPGGGTFGNLDGFAGGTRPVINASGQVAFRAAVEGYQPPPFPDGSAIFLANGPGDVQLVLRDDDPSPDGDGTIQGLLNPHLSTSADYVAVLAVFEFTDSVGTDAGIVVGRPGELEVVGRTGQAFPLGGQTFGNAYFPPQVNGKGTVVFGATSEASLRAGVFAKRAGEPLLELVRPGQLLDGRIVYTASLPSIEDAGGHAFVNDSDEVVFYVEFTDLTTGVYVARLCQSGGPDGVCRALDSDVAAVSLASGGTVAFELDGSAAGAGAVYFLLGSLSGTSPGVPFGALEIPLQVPDPYFNLTLSLAAPLANGLGLLDENGRATITLNLPAGLPQVLVGGVLHHAALALDPVTLAGQWVSNAAPVTWVP